ncbi:MAG: hypothetical protein AABY22_10545 [Nanoarchaeota archaeon]
MLSTKYFPIESEDFQKIRKSIQKAKNSNEIALVVLNNDELLRKIAEKESQIILAADLKNRKDKLYQRDSGFDSVIFKSMTKNNNVYGIILDEFILSDNLMEKAKILSRIKQNVKIAKKTKTDVKFIILREKLKKDHRDLFFFALTLGLAPKTAKTSTSQDF